MESILIAGCGDIGLRVARELRGRFRLFGLARRAERDAKLRSAGITPLRADLDARHSLRRLAGLADNVLHFAPPPDAGDHDPRTRNLLAALSRGRLPRSMVYISTSGVYGDCDGAWVNETRPPHPQTPRARRRLDAERRIRSWAKRNGVAISILRVPGIYAADRLPLERLRAGMPAIVAGEDGYTNHVHADDLARIIIAALRRARPNRVYHASDDSALKMGDYFDAVADARNLSRPRRLPREQLRQAVSPMLWSFMNESRRLENARMKRELKVRLHYPTVAAALAWVVHNSAEQLAAAVARRIAELAAEAIGQRGEFRIALAGGNTPRRCYELLRDMPVDWSRVQAYFGDERCLPRGDAGRNDGMAHDALLAHVAVPPGNVHAIPAERGAEVAAAEYAARLERAMPLDLVLLGMGEDGHTASLFPGNPALARKQAVVPVFDAPKPPTERVSLGMVALNTARHKIFLVAGAGKRRALQSIRRGAALPAAQVTGAEWHVDRDALPGVIAEN